MNEAVDIFLNTTFFPHVYLNQVWNIFYLTLSAEVLLQVG